MQLMMYPVLKHYFAVISCNQHSNDQLLTIANNGIVNTYSLQ